MSPTPALFGLDNSNKDFSKRDSWGKNQFNNAFPIALCCFAHTKKVESVYLKLDGNMKIKKDKIPAKDIFGLLPLSQDLFFAFESDFTPYRTMVVNGLARIDLVTQNIRNDQNLCVRPLEIKLTALPDNATANSSEDEYGSEIVVRPDTIVYLALSIAKVFSNARDELRDRLEPIYDRKGVNWSEFSEVKPLVKKMAVAIDELLKSRINNQTPFMVQPVWKTEGKTLHLHDNCFDIFTWSDFAFTRLFIDNVEEGKKGINRPMRTVVWLSRMLYDFAMEGKIDYRQILNSYNYDTKNDKAFSINGAGTNPYMACSELSSPRISKNEIKKIILGGGEKFLSPERRLDAAILATPELFK